MKTYSYYLLGILISLFLYSCTDEYQWKHKSDFTPDEEISTTQYQEGEKYTRYFYYYQASMEDLLLATFPFPTKALISECGRIRIGITDDDDKTFLPATQYQYNLMNVNETFTNEEGLQFWLIAKFSFIYKELPEGQTYYLTSDEDLELSELEKETDWQILEGYMLPYTWDDRTYDQLVYE